MSGEHQLERSVLEGKERDELHAIADALGLKPASRTKKADLVDKILQVTGVAPSSNGSTNGDTAPSPNGDGANEIQSAEPKPKRPRARKAAAKPAAVEDGEATAIKDDAPAAESTIAASASDQTISDAIAEVAADASSSITDIATPSDLLDAPAAPAGPRRNEGRDRYEGRDRTQGGQREQDQGAQGDRAGQGDRNQGGQRQQDRPQPGNFAQGGGGEKGNRNRRRRGRDRYERGAGGGERDLPGFAQDAPFTGEAVAIEGLIDVTDQGFGLVRAKGYLPSPDDAYVPVGTVKRHGLRKGDTIVGTMRPPNPQEKFGAIIDITSVSGMTIDAARARPRFDELTPLFPDSRLRLEMPGDPSNMVARIVDLISPIGKGQRGLIVSPPKAGKTTVLKQIATSIEANNPDVHLIVLLVDERPEEVTDMRRSVKGEVVASTFDRPSDEHTQIAELTIDRAKRLVEMGKDVVIVLDGITRLARAYNLAAPATGRIMSGGIDTGALYPPKKFFGAARNLDEGGSLTILATALVDTGSRMDEVIFEEFKGTGNMELRLDRRLAEKRIYPAIDVNASSTRHEELLFDRPHLQAIWKLRRVLNALGGEGNGAPGLELLMDKMKTTKTNDEFLAEIAQGPNPPA